VELKYFLPALGAEVTHLFEMVDYVSRDGLLQQEKVSKPSLRRSLTVWPALVNVPSEAEVACRYYTMEIATLLPSIGSEGYF
jgi:hypothetical protein